MSLCIQLRTLILFLNRLQCTSTSSCTLSTGPEKNKCNPSRHADIATTLPSSGSAIRRRPTHAALCTSRRESGSCTSGKNPACGKLNAQIRQFFVLFEKNILCDNDMFFKNILLINMELDNISFNLSNCDVEQYIFSPLITTFLQVLILKLSGFLCRS